MRKLNDPEPRLQPVSAEETAARRSNRSWIPTQPHLLVALDPVRWSQRARQERYWCMTH